MDQLSGIGESLYAICLQFASANSLIETKINLKLANANV